MTHTEKRVLFTRLIVLLLNYMSMHGERPALGKDGEKHMEGSLHYEGLAQDITLYNPDDTVKTKTEDHAAYGAYWKSLHSLCRWGGDFKKPDGNHYSITHWGRA